MRKATYEVASAAGDSPSAEMAVFYFGPEQGGDIESNIQRWVAQFQGIPSGGILRSQREANSLTQHVVEIPEGTYSNAMRPGAPGAPMAGYSLLGAVVLAPTGKYFFKLTGPSATVKTQRDAFFKLLASMKPTTAG